MGLPDKIWVRRGEIISGLGITEEVFTKWIQAGLVTPLYFPGCKWAVFERSEVAKVKPNPSSSKGSDAARAELNTKVTKGTNPSPSRQGGTPTRQGKK